VEVFPNVRAAVEIVDAGGVIATHALISTS
jgi:hypothetical protein